MSKSLLLASLMVAGVYAQSTPDPSLIKGGEFQHLGCVAIKPGTFPRQFDLGQAGCTSSCSTNGNIIAFHGKSCSCDRLDLSPKPIPYQVTKVDNSLCNQWCDPADKSKGTCGGATVRGWPVYDLYKRNDARVVFVPFPGDVATPVAPGQTPAPVPNDPGHKPGDVFHDCPPGVTDCPYRTQCPGGNCGGSKPIPQPCNGCSPPSGGKNWTAPGCPPGGCPPGQNPTPGGGDQNGQGNQGGNGGNGDNGGQGGDNNGGAGGNGDGQDSGNGSQGGQSDSGSSGNGGDSGSGGSDSQSGSDATGGQDGSGQDGAGQGQGSDGTDSGSSAGGSGGSDQGSSGQGGQDDQSGCTGSACPTPVSLGIKAEAGSLMFAVVAGVLVGLW
ncbi:hypothetical protein CEP52_001527 [Fusarium oligoseptatum]|uniref:WSC domain-containing protein n=2 Tax=Fusarium solani species complex TaxID=232080 RepID=A0A428UI76_9HYPO|nr:hypothetical protein CEP51_014019 [Fusarium floridanum]RSM13995.1 hypothetical protein CEP52_001527 [Fusarium oligoseptatum]